jgi:hypothetical protein
MTTAIRNDLTALVHRWAQDDEAMRSEQAKWPMNHVNYRIYSGMINQNMANLAAVIAVMQKHDGE